MLSNYLDTVNLSYLTTLASFYSQVDDTVVFSYSAKNAKHARPKRILVRKLVEHKVKGRGRCVWPECCEVLRFLSFHGKTVRLSYVDLRRFFAMKRSPLSICRLYHKVLQPSADISL